MESARDASKCKKSLDVRNIKGRVEKRIEGNPKCPSRGKRGRVRTQRGGGGGQTGGQKECERRVYRGDNTEGERTAN